MTEQFKNFDNKGCLIKPKDVVKILYCESDRDVKVDQIYPVYRVGRGWIDVTVGENEWETMFPREVEVVKKHFTVTGCSPDYNTLSISSPTVTGTPDNVSLSWSDLGIAFTKSEDGIITVVPKEEAGKPHTDIRKHQPVAYEEWNPDGITEDIEYVDGQVMYYGNYELDDIVVDEDNISQYDESSKQTVVEFIKGMKENK